MITVSLGPVNYGEYLVELRDMTHCLPRPIIANLQHGYFRGQIVLRDMSGMFPPPLPTEYLFLEGGQPLNHKISLRHPYNNDGVFTLLA
mgnify:CR=1 FL=1